MVGPRLGAAAAVAVLAAAVAGAVLLPRVGGDAAGTPAVPTRSAPAGLSAGMIDRTAPAPGGLVRWTARWQLRWQPVPGAVGYVVEAVGPEGRAGAPIRRVPGPEFSLDVAAGTTTEAARRAARDGQAAYRASQLGVTVAAVYPDGSTGPATPVVPVGAVPARAAPGR